MLKSSHIAPATAPREERVAELDDARRMLQRAGIQTNERDEALIEQFLARLRPVAPPAWTTEPWLMPTHGLEWPRD